MAGPNPSLPGMLDDDYWSAFSADFSDYELGGPIGFGASSTVYAASFHPSTTPPNSNAPSTLVPGSSRKPSLTISIPAANPHSGSKTSLPTGEVRECAIKVSSSHPDVAQLFRESRLLGLSRHPNVLRVLATFTLPPDHHRIAIVTPLVGGGSLAGILDWRRRMNSAPQRNRRFGKFALGRKNDDDLDDDECGRLDEEEMKAVTKQVLEGLTYLHGNGFLHRDLKAGNILASHDGTVLLADFGVGGDINAALTPTGRPLPLAEEVQFRQVNGTSENYTRELSPTVDMSEDVGKRKSFVGTPSWMAPEIVLGQRYDAKADIWSLGITLLELAHGFAPRSSEKPNNILRITALEPSPELDRSVGGYSKGMKEFIDICLCKDPLDRPTAAQLLDHNWLRNAKKKAFLADSLLISDDVPALETRQELRRAPSMSTMHSRASSWDFSNDPSSPNSPIRPGFGSMQSPPSLTQFPELPSSTSLNHHSHSRTSSRIPSLPPSPRVPLKQWAERTASESSDLNLKRRSASESPYLSRMALPVRKTSTLSFDDETRGDPLIKPGISKRTPSVEGTRVMSPLVEPRISPKTTTNGGTNDPTESLLLALPEGRVPSPTPQASSEAKAMERTEAVHSNDTNDTATDHARSSKADASPMLRSSSPEVFSDDETDDTHEGIDVRRGRSGTFIAPRPEPPQAPPLRRVESVKDKEKKSWLGRKVSLKKEGEKDGGLMRRFTGRKMGKS